MTFNAHQVCDAIPELIINCSCDSAQFNKISPIEKFGSQSLIFISSEAQSLNLTQELPSVIVTTLDLSQTLQKQYKHVCIIAVHNVRLAQALVKTHFDDFDARDIEWPDIHPSATIHQSASLGDGVRVGPNVVIGSNAQIGNNSIIRSNSVIEHDVIIGNNCIIHSLVNVGHHCTIGNRVIIRPGVIIGNEGFGFAKDDQQKYHRIPHTGTVEIQDDVQIGSNGNIDRGTYGKTVIERGVKIDSLCHIAHNVRVGEDTLFVAQCGIAGSTNIGKKVTISGQSAALDHLNIADGAVLVHRCGVTEDIPTAGLWAGTPAKPMKEYISNLNPSKKIKRLERKLNEKINALEAKLAELDADKS